LKQIGGNGYINAKEETTMKTDKYGRKWDLPKKELCPTCGQPDNSGDCNHKRLCPADVLDLGGEFPVYYFGEKEAAAMLKKEKKG
jgi:hypothetical protein